MTAKDADTMRNWIDPDEPPQWPAEAWERAQFSVGGKVVRPADGTSPVTGTHRRAMRRSGR